MATVEGEKDELVLIMSFECVTASMAAILIFLPTKLMHRICNQIIINTLLVTVIK